MPLTIGYVANHEAGGADDEGAITHALQSLGHCVQRVRQRKGYTIKKIHTDFVLFHHWHDYAAIEKLERPKVAWTFDLVQYPDPMLARRNEERVAWMRRLAGVADLVFSTDGDWVAQDQTGKLVWLPQGADERVVGRGMADEGAPLLFTGISRGGGQGRVEFVLQMQERYGDQFRHIQKGVYREQLRDLIAGTDIVLAPSAPVTHAYWSNRVYNVLGFGGFLLHPYSERLSHHYKDGTEIMYYRDAEHLHRLIREYRDDHTGRQRIATAGLERTQRQHLYRHRCERLVAVVKERLGLNG